MAPINYYVAQVSTELRLSYGIVKTGQTPKLGTILLIHGFPETGYQFRKVQGALSHAGYDIICPDYKGAGSSSKPASSHEVFTKSIMAQELHNLVTEHCGVNEPIHVVGHDIGGMIAYSYARLFPNQTKSVTWGECPLPGTKFYDEIKNSMDMFHFTFHNVPDLPEALVAGRERMYLCHFYDRLGHNLDGIDKEAIDFYTQEFSKAGAMRCGFNVYRAFSLDAEENTAHLKEHGKSSVPCLGLSGQMSALKDGMESMLAETFKTYSVAEVPNSGHWIAEENRHGFIEKVLEFIRENSI